MSQEINNNQSIVIQAAKNFQNLTKNMYTAYRNTYLNATKDVPIVKDVIKSAFSVYDHIFGIEPNIQNLSSENIVSSNSSSHQRKQELINHQGADALQNEEVKNSDSKFILEKSKNGQFSSSKTTKIKAQQKKSKSLEKS